MRFKRTLVVALSLGLSLSLAGCVTTNSDSSSLGKNMPQTSKAQQAIDAARIHTELGQRYMANGDLQTAQTKLMLALKFDPNYAPAHTVLAVLDERINDLPGAELHYRKAVALEPDKGAPNNNLGAFLCHTGKAAEAATYFKKAIADPFYASPDVALTNAGICQAKAHDVAGAEASFRDALARNPNNADALLQLAKTLYANNNAFSARAFLQRFEALGHSSAEALKLGQNIETRLGNPEGALNYSKRLHSQFPDSEQASAPRAATSP
ncbi:MAG: type IV pilus biogenesis/stability protein PilW [Rhodanobacter sp.]